MAGDYLKRRWVWLDELYKEAETHCMCDGKGCCNVCGVLSGMELKSHRWWSSIVLERIAEVFDAWNHGKISEKESMEKIERALSTGEDG